jgi:hypothetical protein
MDFLKSIAPWLAAAASGNVPALLGMAANELSSVLGYDVPADAVSIEKATSSASAEQLLAIKQADQAFAVKMQELGYANVERLEAIAADDRKSARDREIATKDITPKLLAVVVTVGYFSILGYILQYGVPEKGGDALLLMLGALGAGWASILAYYYGSSSGSAAKNDMLLRAK